MKDTYEIIEELLNTYELDYSLAADLYTYVISSEEKEWPALYLEILIMGRYEKHGTESYPRQISTKQTELLREMNDETVFGLIDHLIDENPSEDEFYIELLKTIRDAHSLNEEEKKVAFASTFTCANIPYYQLKEDNDPVDDMLIQDTKSISIALCMRMDYVLNSTHFTISERSAELLKLLDCCTDRDTRLFMTNYVFTNFAIKFDGQKRLAAEYEMQLEEYEERNKNVLKS